MAISIETEAHDRKIISEMFSFWDKKRRNLYIKLDRKHISIFVFFDFAGIEVAIACTLENEHARIGSTIRAEPYGPPCFQVATPFILERALSVAPDSNLFCLHCF